MKFFRGVMVLIVLMIRAFSIPVGSAAILTLSQEERLDQVSLNLLDGLI